MWPVLEGKTASLEAGSSVKSLVSTTPQRFVASGLVDGRVAIWRGLNEEAAYASWGHNGSPVRGLCLLGDDRVASGGQDGSLAVLSRGEGIQRWATWANEPIASLACGKNTIISGHVRSIETWREGEDTSRRLGQHGDIVTSLALAGDDRTLVSGSVDKTVRRWDVETGRELEAHRTGHWVYTVAALGPSDVLFGTADGKLRRWRGGLVEEISPPHHGALTMIAAHQGLLATAGEDGLLLRGLTSGAFRALPHGHSGAVPSVLFSDDGLWLVSGGSDKLVLVWPLPPLHPSVFSTWLNVHTPWTLEGGKLTPKPVPPLSEAFAGPEPPPPDPGCIDICRAMKTSKTLPEGLTLETCVLHEACKSEQR